MYIVRRAFRNNGVMMLPGSIVEPGSIKLFKSRLRDNRIIEVEEQDLDRWRDFFKKRYGVDIELPKATQDAETTSDFNDYGFGLGVTESPEMLGITEPAAIPTPTVKVVAAVTK